MSNSQVGGRPALRELSDEALLRRIQADPEDDASKRAASELLGRYRRNVYLWCHRLLRDHERALDLSQDVLLAAYRGLPNFDGRCSVSTWLFVIARNRGINELARPQLQPDPEFELHECVDGSPDPELELLEKESENAILALIRRHLDATEQRALWMRCFERMPVDAITAALQLPDRSGARAVLQRARRKLKSALADREREDRDEGGGTWIENVS